MIEADNRKFWEARYAAGQQQRYPWDSVVSFLFRYMPKDRERRDVKVLEVGSGTGANLWFAAREGFSVTGIEISATAVQSARDRFQAESLEGEFVVGDFTKLPFDDASFDLIFDRASLTSATYDKIEMAVREVTRVAKAGAHFFFNPYADSHSGFHHAGQIVGRTALDITKGSLAGIKQCSFVSASDIRTLLDPDWQLLSLRRVELTDMMIADASIHAEWRVVARRR